jgi:hypothetical protein
MCRLTFGALIACAVAVNFSASSAMAEEIYLHCSLGPRDASLDFRIDLANSTVIVCAECSDGGRLVHARITGDSISFSSTDGRYLINRQTGQIVTSYTSGMCTKIERQKF